MPGNFVNQSINLVGKLTIRQNLIGSLSVPVSYNNYVGAYEVEPDFVEQKLATKEKFMTNDVTVKSIRVSETSNTYGTTIYIGRVI